MGSDKETRLQRYLRFFADHRLFSIVILTAIIVAGIGTFAGNLKSLISFVPEKPPSSNVTLLVNVKNADVDSIEIRPLCEFYLTEDKGAIIQEYPKGRASLVPVGEPDHRGPYALAGRETKRYSVTLPDLPDYLNLLERGAANLHVVVWQADINRFGVDSIPFQKDTLRAECVNNFETPVAGSLVSNAAFPRVRAAWVLEG